MNEFVNDTALSQKTARDGHEHILTFAKCLSVSTCSCSTCVTFVTSTLALVDIFPLSKLPVLTLGNLALTLSNMICEVSCCCRAARIHGASLKGRFTGMH